MFMAAMLSKLRDSKHGVSRGRASRVDLFDLRRGAAVLMIWPCALLDIADGVRTRTKRTISLPTTLVCLTSPWRRKSELDNRMIGNWREQNVTLLKATQRKKERKGDGVRGSLYSAINTAVISIDS